MDTAALELRIDHDRANLDILVWKHTFIRSSISGSNKRWNIKLQFVGRCKFSDQHQAQRARMLANHPALTALLAYSTPPDESISDQEILSRLSSCPRPHYTSPTTTACGLKPISNGYTNSDMMRGLF